MMLKDTNNDYITRPTVFGFGNGGGVGECGIGQCGLFCGMGQSERRTTMRTTTNIFGRRTSHNGAAMNGQGMGRHRDGGTMGGGNRLNFKGLVGGQNNGE